VEREGAAGDGRDERRRGGAERRDQQREAGANAARPIRPAT
jgi:hypothetical protein